MIDIYRHLRVDDMKWVYSEGVLTDVDSDHRMGKGLKLYLYLNTWKSTKDNQIADELLFTSEA